MIAVVGSGPVGNYAALQLAKAGQEVTVFEEHDRIGDPVQCTGILTPDIHGLLKVKASAIVNRIKRIELMSPGNTSFTLKLREPELILNRTLFDSSIAEEATRYGVKVKKGHRFITKDRNKAVFMVKGKTMAAPFSRLIGADGPVSRVAKASGLLEGRAYYGAMQATVRGKFDKDVYQAFFGKDYPEFFGWLVPENEETARIGLGTRTNTNPYFRKFLRKRIGESWEKEVVGYQHGLIPIHDPFAPIEKGNTYLVGDAATQVKATTGGGIIPGMKAARALRDAIVGQKGYKRAVWKHGGKELLAHLMVRKALDRFSDEDYDRLLSLASQAKVKRILETTSRERPTEILWRSLIREPRLLRFAKIIFQQRQQGTLG